MFNFRKNQLVKANRDPFSTMGRMFDSGFDDFFAHPFLSTFPNEKMKEVNFNPDIEMSEKRVS